ncbi:MAG: 5'/3'-nucleotidase SurE [Thermoprotei archaeon]|jgi:5'-nucleotidase
MKHILISNDDGIGSIGLIALKRALEGLGALYIVAPEINRSGISKALQMFSLKIKQVVLDDGSIAYAINGTPADSYFIFRYKIFCRDPDLVVSGINLGCNVGIGDILTSGTIGVALEAGLHGVPAIAVSLCVDSEKKLSLTLDDFNVAMRIVRQIAERILIKGMPHGIHLISINVPENPQGIEITKPAWYVYGDVYVDNGDGTYSAARSKTDIYDNFGENNSDITAVFRKKFISITPIRIEIKSPKKILNNLLKDIRL